MSFVQLRIAPVGAHAGGHLKYVVLILRADNHGEGGGLALTALATQAVAHRPRLRQACFSGRVRRHAFLRRQPDHTCHFGARCNGGLEVLTPTLTPYCGASHRGHPGRTLLCAACWYGGGRSLLWAHHCRVVRRIRHHRRMACVPSNRHPGCAQPTQCVGVPGITWLAHVCCRRRDRIGTHGC